MGNCEGGDRRLVVLPRKRSMTLIWSMEWIDGERPGGRAHVS